jgi:DNA modification methylase
MTYARKEQIGDATLYLGDCLEILPTLPAESADIIWTDPPYGHNNNDGDLIHRWEAALGKPIRDGEDAARPIANDGAKDMRRVVDGMLVEAARILKRDCCCCCCCGGGGPRPTFAWLAERMDRTGLSFFHAVVWDKGGLGMGWRYRRNYEMVMIAHRRGGKLKWETERSDAITANVVRLSKIIPSRAEHPTPKPVELPLHFLSLHGKRGDTVLDPFMGAGPCGEAAARLGMRYLGIEIEPRYFDIACRRIEQAYAQGRLFEPEPKKQEQAALFGEAAE